MAKFINELIKSVIHGEADHWYTDHCVNFITECYYFYDITTINITGGTSYRSYLNAKISFQRSVRNVSNSRGMTYLKTIRTRQSAMTTTSPRHVYPIKIGNFDIFCDVISLLARVFLYFSSIGLPKRFPCKIFTGNCRSSVWDIHHWIAMLDVYWRGMRSLMLCGLTYRKYVCTSL